MCVGLGARAAQPGIPAGLCGIIEFLRGPDHPGRGTVGRSRCPVNSGGAPPPPPPFLSAQSAAHGECHLAWRWHPEELARQREQADGPDSPSRCGRECDADGDA